MASERGGIVLEDFSAKRARVAPTKEGRTRHCRGVVRNEPRPVLMVLWVALPATCAAAVAVGAAPSEAGLLLRLVWHPTSKRVERHVR